VWVGGCGTWYIAVLIMSCHLELVVRLVNTGYFRKELVSESLWILFIISLAQAEFFYLALRIRTSEARSSGTVVAADCEREKGWRIITKAPVWPIHIPQPLSQIVDSTKSTAHCVENGQAKKHGQYVFYEAYFVTDVSCFVKLIETLKLTISDETENDSLVNTKSILRGRR
jgi:hypothetical protein